MIFMLPWFNNIYQFKFIYEDNLTKVMNPFKFGGYYTLQLALISVSLLLCIVLKE